jgi:hypothetical protein
MIRVKYDEPGNAVEYVEGRKNGANTDISLLLHE